LITFRLAVAAKVISSAFGVKEIGKEIKVKNSYAPTGFFTLATRGEMPSLFPPWKAGGERDGKPVLGRLGCPQQGGGRSHAAAFFEPNYVCLRSLERGGQLVLR
jgi:hypothetical protein